MRRPPEADPVAVQGSRSCSPDARRWRRCSCSASRRRMETSPAQERCSLRRQAGQQSRPGSRSPLRRAAAVALVTATPDEGTGGIVVRRPSACPVSWSRWLFAYRVKSGMFSDSVAQKPTIAVSHGRKQRTGRGVGTAVLRVSQRAPTGRGSRPDLPRPHRPDQERAAHEDQKRGGERLQRLMLSVPAQTKYTLMQPEEQEAEVVRERRTP